MIERKTIADYMVSDVVTLPPGLEINQALTLLLERKVSGAPVVDETGDLIGILTKKDGFRAALNATYYKQWGGTVSKYMSKTVETLDADLDVVTAAETFLSSPYRFFPVTREGRMVGILSRSDLLRAFAGPRSPGTENGYQ